MHTALLWGAEALCLAGSALCSGMTLGLFSLSRLELELLAARQHAGAVGILRLRRDSNRLLCSLLWSNVAVNVSLSLLSDRLLPGLAAFAVSTTAITVFGEILPQAVLARHALTIAPRLLPAVRLLEVLTWPLAKPCGVLLDRVVGPDGISFFKERDVRRLLTLHRDAAESDIGEVEAVIALAALLLDDLAVGREGQPVDPRSIMPVPSETVVDRAGGALLQHIASCRKAWVILTEDGTPTRALDVNSLLRELFASGDGRADLRDFWHRPVIVTDPATPLGDVLGRLRVEAEHPGDLVVDEDVILVWTDETRRIITGADLLGRLLRGVVARDPTLGST